MRTASILSGGAIALALAFAACSKDDAEDTQGDLVGAPHPNTVLAMNMSYTRAGAAFDKSVAFQDAAGTWIKIDRIKYFMSQPWFTDDAGDTVAMFPEKYLEVDLDDGAAVQGIGEVDGHLHEIHFALGIDSATNHSDPVTFGSPLNDPDMWWTWAAGFKFLLLEGRYDSNLDNQVDGSDNQFYYHCGMDTLYTPATIHIHTDADQGGNVILPFDLNIDTLMAGLNVAANPVVQTVTPETAGLMQRLATAITHVE